MPHFLLLVLTRGTVQTCRHEIRLMNAIKKGSVKTVIQPAETLSEKRVNIEAFLTAAAGYGVQKNKLFHLLDLLLLQNLPRVTACKSPDLQPCVKC